MLKNICICTSLITGLLLLSTQASAADKNYVFKAGHPSLREWRLPRTEPYPRDNKPTPARIELGKKLFFDPRLSGDANMTCATCHHLSRHCCGTSDGP